MPGTGKLILGTPKVVSLPERATRLAIWPLGVNTANASHGQRLHQRTEVRWPQSGIPRMRNAAEYSSHILLLIRCIPRACSLVVRPRCLCKGQRSDARSGDRAGYGRQLTVEGKDGSRSMVAMFDIMGWLYQIEAKMLPGGNEFELTRFQQSLVHPSGIEGLIILARGPRYSARGFPA